MEKLITLFLTLGLTQSLQSANLEGELNLNFAMPFDYEQIAKDGKLIKDWEERNRLRFWDNQPYPSEEQIRYSWRVHALDMITTVYALENRDNVKEANWVLGEQPEIHEVFALKMLVLPFIHQNSNEHMMVYFNAVTTATVVHNLYVIDRYN